MQRLTYAFLCAVVLVCTTQAHAEQYMTVGAGWFDFKSDSLDKGTSRGSTDFVGEWKGSAFLEDFVPVVGAMVNTDGGVLGYAGVNYDWQFAPSWFLTPGFDIGAWSRGSSLDLGGTFEFHETLALDYAFFEDYRAGLEVSHTSNAHIYDHNPGANALLATFSVPFGN